MTNITVFGRLVAGSLYNPQDTDFNGQPLVVKSGPNQGQPRVEYYFGLAVPKQGETAWWVTEWGQKILQAAYEAWPGGETQMPTFAWKIVDGDSTTPNRRGTIPNTLPGYPGHWVLNLSSGFAPKIFWAENGNITDISAEPNRIKNGYYVEANFDVNGNKNASNPGIYLNHRGVCFAAYGEEINTGLSPEQMGFGQQHALPPGASTAPMAPTHAPPAYGEPQMPQGQPQMPQGQPQMPQGVQPPSPQPQMPQGVQPPSPQPQMPQGQPQMPQGVQPPSPQPQVPAGQYHPDNQFGQ